MGSMVLITGCDDVKLARVRESSMIGLRATYAVIQALFLGSHLS